MTRLFISGGRLIDSTGREPVPNLGIVTSGARVVGVGAPNQAGDVIVDCTGLTVLPGLIDAHVHLAGAGHPVERAFRHGELSAAELAAGMFRTCEQLLSQGFTTVRDTGGIDGGLVRAIERGLVRGPRVLSCGPLLCQTGGHGHLQPAFAREEEWERQGIPGLLQLSLLSDGPARMRRNCRRAFRRGASFLKLCVTGGVVSLTDSPEDVQLSVEEIRAAVEEAAARHTYVTAHAHGDRGVRRAVEAGVACVEHGTGLSQETAALMARQGVRLVPTLSVVRLMSDAAASMGVPPEIASRSRGVLDGMAQAIEVAQRAGVLIGSGSDLLGGVQDRHGLELGLKARVMGAMGALLSATAVNARILGLQDDLGILEPGKLADIIAVDGDPLQDPGVLDGEQRVVLVVKNGEVEKDIQGRVSSTPGSASSRRAPGAAAGRRNV